MRFTHTKNALVVYDMQQIKMQYDFNNIETNQQMHQWELEQAQLMDKVRLAFFEDTKEINSLSDCMATDIGYLKTIVSFGDKE